MTSRKLCQTCRINTGGKGSSLCENCTKKLYDELKVGDLLLGYADCSGETLYGSFWLCPRKSALWEGTLIITPISNVQSYTGSLSRGIYDNFRVILYNYKAIIAVKTHIQKLTKAQLNAIKKELNPEQLMRIILAARMK